MPKLTPEQQAAALQQLAERIDQAGWRDSAAFALDVVGPLDVVASQLAAFTRPFIGTHPWALYAEALAEPAAWRVLRQLITPDLPPDP